MGSYRLRTAVRAKKATPLRYPSGQRGRVSTAKHNASVRNISKAHITRFRSHEPRSPGRVRPARRR